MSAVRSRRQDYWEDNSLTQAVPAGAVRAAHATQAMPLRPVPRQAGQRAQSWDAQPHRSPLAGLPDPSRLAMTLLFICALAIVLYFGITSLIAFTQTKLDDLHYGRPRTSQLDAWVGHNETSGSPTHLVAMNLNRRVTIIEFPGGDASKPQVIIGPYLFGRAEDLTVVKLRVEDINADDKPDLLVQVKDERLVYINENGAFRPVTADELAQLKQQEGGR